MVLATGKITELLVGGVHMSVCFMINALNMKHLYIFTCKNKDTVIESKIMLGKGCFGLLIDSVTVNCKNSAKMFKFEKKTAVFKIRACRGLNF